MSKKANPTDELIELCVDIFAHSNLDMEVTIGGNGTNCCEAANVAREILGILKVKRSDIKADVEARVAELKEEHGMGDDVEAEEEPNDEG